MKKRIQTILLAVLFLVIASSSATFAADIKVAENTASTYELMSGDPEANNEIVPIYRVYNRITGEHLYTASHEEAYSLSGNDWYVEGTEWEAPTTGDAVYRLFNPELNDHLYTTDTNEVDTLTDGHHGWIKDFGGEPAFYSGGNINVYRMFNQTSGRHLFTTSENEYNTLTSQGWTKEGVKIFGLS